GKVQVTDLGTGLDDPLPKGGELEENWLLLWSTQDDDMAPRPLLVALERRPTFIEAVEDGFGGLAIELQLARRGARIMLVRPLDGPLDAQPGTEQVERCRLWSRALMRYPIGYVERLSFDGDRCSVRMAYEYLELNDDWGTTSLPLAPLPMLFSYALEHKWPEARVEGKVLDLGCRSRSGYYPDSDCGTYRAVLGQSEVAYSYGRVEPSVRYMGIGSLGEERRLGEPMFIRVKEWGSTCFRPQIPFHNTGFFRHDDRRFTDTSRVEFADEALAWLDAMLDTHQRLGLTCFLNWFGLEGRRLTEANRRQVRDFWVQMARHCRDLPPDLVCYDLMNEPAGLYGGRPLTRNAWDEYNAFVRELTAAIREVDPVHPVSVEAGGGWAQPEDLDMTEPTGDPNTIYQFHFYGPHTGDCHRWDLWYPRYQLDEERFRSYEGWEERMLSPIRFHIRNQAELFHGEFGISFLGPDDAPRLWLEDVLGIHDKYRIHWAWWNYSGNEIHRTGLMSGERVNPLVATLRKYARAK
ncbi:MAG: cellulase family glycosylhydrolase, partial [Armatimonadota bacterium]